MRIVIVAATLLACHAVTFAQVETLAKAEVETLFVGKTVVAVRSDGIKTRTEIKPDGWMFINTSAGGSGKARWTINENGQLCWKGVGSSGDGCRAYVRKEGKVLVYDPANMEKPSGEIENIR